MGCDIHICTEAFKESSGNWVNTDKWTIDNMSEVSTYSVGENLDIEYVYHDRNYELFSFLAGVRNYSNNKNFEFDRGIPNDASKPTIALYTHWGCDAHTPGYCTLKELKCAATEKIVKYSGYVSPEDYELYQNNGVSPSTWCQWTSRDNWKYLEWETDNLCFDKLIKALDERKREVFWISDKGKDTGEFDDKFRIVFWFDN